MASSSSIILQKLYCLSVRKGIPKPVPVLHKHLGQLQCGNCAEGQHNAGMTEEKQHYDPEQIYD